MASQEAVEVVSGEVLAVLPVEEARLLAEAEEVLAGTVEVEDEIEYSIPSSSIPIYSPHPLLPNGAP